MIVGKRVMQLVAMGVLVGLVAACGGQAKSLPTVETPAAAVAPVPAPERAVQGTEPEEAAVPVVPERAVQGTEPEAASVPVVPEQPVQGTVPEAASVLVVQEQAVQVPRSEPAPVESLAVVHKLVMLDPGHQRHGNNAPEAVGPDTRETKPKVSSGTVGVHTKKPEYVLNLEVSQLIKAELMKRGIESCDDPRVARG